MQVSDKNINNLLLTCREFCEEFPDGVIWLGDIAAHVHNANNPTAESPQAGTLHNATFYIGLADMADLRDIQRVIPNRDLCKHHMTRHGFEFDIYTERHSNLIVPYDAVASESVTYNDIRVAAIEHLLALKLEAYSDRKSSSKGEKDARDILRICLIAKNSDKTFQSHLAAPHLSDTHMELFAQVIKGAQATSLAHGNAMKAKAIRQSAQAIFDAIDGDRKGCGFGPTI